MPFGVSIGCVVLRCIHLRSGENAISCGFVSHVFSPWTQPHVPDRIDTHSSVDAGRVAHPTMRRAATAEAPLGVDTEASAAQRMAAKLRPRVILPWCASSMAARTAEVRGRQLQRLVRRRPPKCYFSNTA